MTPCKVEGCNKHANRVGAGLCEMHYARLRRNASLDLVKPAPEVLEHSHGYLLDYAPGHPLETANGKGRVYQHRRVYYDAHGAGPFNCFHCGAVVVWGALHIDHLDDNKQNNTISNLAASCPVCNQQRGKQKMVDTLRVRYGVTAFGKTQTLNEWAAEYRISRPAIVDRLKRGWSAEDAISAPSRKHRTNEGAL